RLEQTPARGTGRRESVTHVRRDDPVDALPVRAGAAEAMRARFAELTFRLLVIVICLLVKALVVPPASSGYDWSHPGQGPWRGQVVDRETRQPLEGVVVAAVWNKRYGSVGGWAGGGYFASEEVVSGPDGRFTIQSLKKPLLDPFAILEGPEFYIFKGGY